MSRVLFVVPPLVGHVNPTVALGEELTARGHAVAWAGLPEVVGDLLPAGAELHRTVGGMDAAAFGEIEARGKGLRGPAALRFLWEDFLVPLARHTLDDVSTAVEEFGPDVVVVDQQAVAGAVVARRRGLRWLTSATTSAELTDPLSGLPKVAEWVRAQLVELQSDAGVEPELAATGDLRFSPYGVLAFTTGALVGPDVVVPGDVPVSFVGPSIAHRGEATPFPWERLDGRPLVLVSLGTINADVGERFFGVARDALAELDVQSVFVAPPELVDVDGTSPDVIVAPRVPQLALLERASAVISHGGHNTVCEALSHGLPLVLAPIRDDQPIVADQVVRAGAGVRVRFARVRAPELREAVAHVLEAPEVRAAASVVARSFRDAGGAPAAAEVIESVAVADGSANQEVSVP